MTTADEIRQIVQTQRDYFNSGATLPYATRLKALKTLKSAVAGHEKQFMTALAQDLGKCEFEAWATEIGFVLSDLDFTIRRLKKWMRPQRVKTPFYLRPGSTRLHHVPLGVNLIIGPFNYPMQLAFAP